MIVMVLRRSIHMILSISISITPRTSMQTTRFSESELFSELGDGFRAITKSHYQLQVRITARLVIVPD